MHKKRAKEEGKDLRHLRIRRKVKGSEKCPRVCVYRANRYIYAQIIDDTKGNTLVSASSLSPEIKDKIKGFTTDAAREVGTVLAKKAKEKGIEKVVFDRGGYKYHGKVKALAEAARVSGLKF